MRQDFIDEFELLLEVPWPRLLDESIRIPKSAISPQSSVFKRVILYVNETINIELPVELIEYSKMALALAFSFFRHFLGIIFQLLQLLSLAKDH